MDFRLYINGSICDTDGVPIRLNKVVRDVQNINRRGGTFSFTINLPISRANRAIFDQAQGLQVTGKFASRETYDALLQGPNGELLLDGTFRLSDITDTFNGVLYSSNIFFAQLIGDKTLRDIKSFDIAPFDPFNATNGIEWYLDRDIDQVDIQFPLVAYGNFFDGGAADNYRSNEITQIAVDDWLPSVYYLTVVKKIFADIGFTVSGEVFDDPEIKKWVMPFTGERFAFGALGGARLTHGEQLIDPFNSVTQELNKYFFTCKSDDTYHIFHEFRFTNYDSAPDADVSIIVYEPDGITVKLTVAEGSYTIVTSGNTKTFTYDADLGALNTGDIIEIYAEPVGFGTPPNIDNIYGEQDWEVTIVGQPQGIDPAKNLPEINQKDFIGDFITFFNQFFEVKDKHIYFFTENDYQAPQGQNVDISNYVDLSKGVKIRRDEVYRERRWEYSNQEDDDLLSETPDLGNHSIIDLRVVNTKVKTYTVGFSATVNRDYEIQAPSVVTVSLPVISRNYNEPLNEVQWEFDHTPRIIKYLGKGTEQIDVQGNNVLIGRGQFTNDQHFSELVDKYYNVIQNVKGNVIEVFAHLPPWVVVKLEQRYRVVLNGDSYALSSFTEYDPSRVRPAKLTLIKEVA